ncbi:MAG: hypothetical protein IAG10_35500 [Planctomycetaceae bacterium]|nr:hypothetical protein [Planctomycetaceae bacterium]
MRSQSRSSLSTLVFMVPLLGVPLMAIFGVPQFVPVIASSVSDDVARPSSARRSRGVGESAAATPLVSENASRDDARIDDLFRPSRPSQRDSRPLRGEPLGREIKFVETSVGADTWLTQTSAEDQAADIFSDRPKGKQIGERGSRAGATTPARHEDLLARASSARTVTTAEHSDQGLTWREAVRRLNELGIQEFRLEPGRQLGEFYFVCEFTPDRDTRITRRFEAEAKEPLLAVAAVLRQIDEWLPRR